ncbi:tyrosyl-DNA phosphodiesterase [Pyronema omphalodes]|nr:tyrosyl-DNA phosphodiesterase [Pyronema omphalodes]
MIKSIPSPFRLLRVKDLPMSDNKDTVGIKDILGNPMLKEVWLFNYMHNIPWVMSQFDPDIRPHLQVTFVHGWKYDDASRMQMEEDAKDFSGVRLIAAYLPEMFGTHHTKMMILFRHDDTAQIVIHTANMIPMDWDRLTNAAWLSPILPLKTPGQKPSPIGDKFESDLTAYLLSYSKAQMGSLVASLSKFSFSSIRAVFISSAPGRHDVYKSQFGWPNLSRELSKIPCSDKSKIFAQCSSIATFGVKDTWLSPIFFHTLSSCKNKKEISKPPVGIIWPTVKDIQESLSGYDSGSSIHLRTHSVQHQKQLEYVKPLFYRWSKAQESSSRDKVPPHVKTYIRYADGMKKIDWALLTSANISKQAWGEATKDGRVRICSYEVGVLVYPGLWDEEDAPQMEMVPVLEEDMPKEDGKVGIRVPYGFPPEKYGKEDEPWCKDKAYREPDRMGRYWGMP